MKDLPYAGPSDAEDGPPPVEVPRPLLDLGVLEALAGPASGVMTLERLLASFEEEIPRLFLDIQAGLEEGDPKAVQGAVEALGSLASMVGATMLCGVAEEYEHAAREEDLVDGEARLLAMMEVYEATAEALRAVFVRRL